MRQGVAVATLRGPSVDRGLIQRLAIAPKSIVNTPTDRVAKVGRKLPPFARRRAVSVGPAPVPCQVALVAGLTLFVALSGDLR